MTIAPEAVTTTKVTVMYADDLATVLHNASLFAASKGEYIPVLASVLLLQCNGRLEAVATNRYVLGVAHTVLDDEDRAEDFRFLLSLADCKVLLTTLKALKRELVRVSVQDGQLIVESFGTSSRFRPVEGEFPRYERLIPNPEDADQGVAQIAVNPGYIALLAKVRSDRNAPARLAFYGPSKPIRFDIGETMHGCIMPVRIP